jgi:hypothetical protein
LLATLAADGLHRLQRSATSVAKHDALLMRLVKEAWIKIEGNISDWSYKGNSHRLPVSCARECDVI